MKILSQIQQIVTSRTRKRAMNHAIENTMSQFVQRHPRWADSLLDGFLLRGKEDALLENRLAPTELALAWTKQLRYRDEAKRQAHVAELTPITAELLSLLGQEMGKMVRV